MREWLERRPSGLDFDRAWAYGWARIEWPDDDEERAQWKEALTCTRGEFHAAYRGNGSPGLAAALSVILRALEHDGRETEDSGLDILG